MVGQIRITCFIRNGSGDFLKIAKYIGRIIIADQKYNEHILNGNKKPTEMCPCTTVHRLVREIKSKIPEG
jgi:hypothetical protein